METLMVIVIGSIFISNYVLGRFLGLCPFLGVSKQLDSAVGMGLAVIFVMGLASLFAWVISYALLEPATCIWSKILGRPIDLTFLQTIAYILVIAAFVQFVEMVIQKTMPALYQALGIYLPLITTNCCVMGVVLINSKEHYNLIQSIVSGVAAGAGFTLAIILMASIRERLAFASIPKALQGFPIAFIVTGCMSIAFLGFSGFTF
jgi:electron transport complex protein RnfA